MFDFFRNHTRLALGFMLLLIIPSFVFFGVEGYSKFNDGTTATVASVDGKKVTQQEWDNLHRRAVQNARLQPGVDPATLETPAMRKNTLDAIVRERVLLAAATDMHLAPSDARLQRLFATDPQFGPLRKPDGTVNRELLASQGMTSELFVQRLRQEYSMQQVLGGASRSVLAPTAVASAALDPLMQRREIQYEVFALTAYRDKVKPLDADIEAYHKAHAQEFKATEQATIEYVQLDLDTLTAGVTLTDADVKKAYDDNLAKYTAPEERQARHILINADKSQPEAARSAAKAKADQLLAQARKNPEGFAELARKNSQDGGSAPQGGDLGFFGRGAMVKPFEDAAFGMKAGDIVGPVETDYGYHVIQLLGTKGGAAKPFDEVRAEITAELRKSAAQKLWAANAEQFTDLVYQQSDSLQPAVDKFKLKKTTVTVQRRPAPGASGPLASTKLLDAVFGQEVLTNKKNTDAIEVAPNVMVSARLVQHLPERLLPLAEVRAAVLDRVTAEQAKTLAKKDGQAKLAAWGTAAPAEADKLTKATVSRAQPQGLPREVLEAVLRASTGKLPTQVGVELADGGYAVVRVLAVLPREAVAANEESLRQQYAQAWGAAESEALLESLKKRYKAQVTPEADKALAAPAGAGR